MPTKQEAIKMLVDALEEIKHANILDIAAIKGG